jgi:hypothetical protein
MRKLKGFSHLAAGSADVPSAVVQKAFSSIHENSFSLRAQCGRDVRAPSSKLSSLPSLVTRMISRFEVGANVFKG